MRIRAETTGAAFARDRRGVAVVELALTLPVLLTLMFGILTGGSWLALSHAVQQGANEGARAAIAGLTQAERATIATDTARAALRQSYGIDAADVAVTVNDDGARIAVAVRYDGSANPLLSLPIMPAPATVIERRASIVLSGL